MENTQDLIVFRAFDTKKQQPATLRPLQDKSGRLYTGQGSTGYYELLTEAEKKALPFVVDPFTKVIITDGFVMDPKNNPVDAINWKWVQKHPYVVLNKEKKSSSRDAVFYVQNLKKEAEQRVTSTKLRDKARYLVQFDLSVEKLRYTAKVLGHANPESFGEDEIRDYLLQFCETAPEAVISASSMEDSAKSEAIILFNDLKKWRLISKHRGGWRFGGEDGPFVGVNDEKVIEFLQNPEKQDTVAAMKAELDVRQKSA